MSHAEPPVGEDDIQAHFDGRLGSGRREAVARYLDDHPELAARLEQDREALDALRARLASKAEEPIPARLRVANISAGILHRRVSRFRAAAAVALWLGVGGLGGWTANAALSGAPDQPVRLARMADDAIAAHRTFVVEVAHPVEVGVDEEAHLVGWLSKRLRTAISAPDLRNLGYRLMGGRLLPAGSGPAAMLMYDNDAGLRLTLYVKNDETQETAFQFVEEDGFAAFLWRDRGLGYVVTAAAPREALMPVARAIYDQLDEAGAVPAEDGTRSL